MTAHSVATDASNLKPCVHPLNGVNVEQAVIITVLRRREGTPPLYPRLLIFIAAGNTYKFRQAFPTKKVKQ